MTQNQPVTEGTIARLLSGIGRSRDRAIVGLMANSGLRPGEIERLNRDSISLSKRANSFASARISGKHGPRVVPVDTATAKAILKWLTERGRDDSDALFVSPRRQRLTSRVICQCLQHWSRRLGLEPLTSRHLRASQSARLASAGVPPLWGARARPRKEDRSMA
jgi:site-specific recombinase XerC